MGNPEEDAMTDGESLHRLFTVAEANALLPTLVPILTRLREQKETLDSLRRALEQLTPAMRGNGHGAEAADLEGRLTDVATELSLGIRQVLQMGVEIKDLNQGLIDFPSRRDDRVVYLCWHLGEGPVAFWHELDGGFAGRQPLE
jgi:hypothetical protein